MSDDLKFIEALERFGDDLFTQNPELGEMIQRVRSGGLDPKDVIREVWRIAGTRRDFDSELERALYSAFGVDPASTDLAHFPDRQRMLDRWGFTDEDLIYQPFEDRPDYKMLHPLLMGMIVELIQFDGDVPELRTGPMPEGGTPAVPVETTARNPVVVGEMLRRASEEVAFELGAAGSEHEERVVKMIEVVGGVEGAGGLVRQETEHGVGVPGYGPGQKALFRRVGTPGGSELARMGFEERQELAHKALTSTQGRRSAAPVIATMVLEALHDQDFTGIAMGEGSEVVVEAEWVVSIDGGRGERNPNFNFIDTAARSIATKLGQELKGRASRYTRLRLKVTPINEIAERRVGWRATLCE